jgi:acyl-CoA reductase-like NAD-dependent aldehyde dehydrogenase
MNAILKNFIGGEWVDGAGITRNINPSNTNDVVGEYAKADKAQTEKAIAAANREEIFGPVATVIRARNYDEALAIANDTEFGLASGICTSSLKYASHFKRNSDAGMVMVNLPTAGVDYHVPFGGRKGSSYGAREQGSYAREFYTAVKTAYIYPV